MKASVIIRKNNINWAKLVLNIFNKENFGKKYLIYQYKDIKISFLVSDFDFLREVITIKIEVEYIYNDNLIKTFNYAYLFLKNYSFNFIKKYMVRRIKSTIDMIKDEITEKDLSQRYKIIYTDKKIITEENIKKGYFGDEYKEIYNNCFHLIKKELIKYSIQELKLLIYKDYNKKYYKLINDSKKIYNSKLINNFNILKNEISEV